MISLPPALLHPDFRRLWVSMLCSGVAMQMAQVAIGWQVYSIHHSAFDLGLIGLAEFVPVALLALPAGQIADRLPRVTLTIFWGFADAVVAALLLLVTIHGADQLWQFVLLALMAGTIAAMGNPAGRSLVPELVPADLLTGAIALRSIAFQAATIAGRAVGGLLFAISPEAVYGSAVGLLVAASLILFPITRPRSSLGVASATVVERIFMLSMSTKPLNASATTDSAYECERPNTIVPAPNRLTAISSVRPTLPRNGRRASMIPALRAPTAIALRSTPSPNGPVCRIERA